MQATQSLHPTAAPWWKHRWPWFLMLGPALVVVAGAYTSYLAIRSPEAMVVGDYYKQGKAINQDLHRDRVASQLGLSLGLRYDAAAGALRGTLLAHGLPLPGKVRVLLAHPTLPSRDIAVMGDLRPDGSFDAPLPQLEHTRWQVTAEDAARTWRLEGVWSFPERRNINVQADVPADD
ncbi:MAG: FixH family protein [Telluria sp.]